MKRGKLIVIEGTDASGKGTQTELLLDRLQHENIPAKHITFPRYDAPTGRIVGECYLGKNGAVPWFEDPAGLDPRVASLYYAADRLFAAPYMREVLASGRHLICDRYVESNKGHQGGKIQDPAQRKEIVDFIDRLEYGHLQLPVPDNVLFLYVPSQVSMVLKKSMSEKADSHESNEEHIKNAEKSYLELATRYNWTKIDCAPDGTMNSLRTPEEIHEEVYGYFKRML